MCALRDSEIPVEQFPTIGFKRWAGFIVYAIRKNLFGATLQY